jgi:hypothetical protein
MTMTGVHAGIDAGPRYQNLLRNSDFEDASTANLPDFWTAVTGTVGTHILQVSTAYRGVSALGLAGDGTLLHRIVQQLNSVSGTPAALVADRLYCVTFAARTRFSPTTGVVRVSVCDSSYNPLTNAFTTVNFGIGTTYGLNSFTFRAPLSLSTPIYLMIDATTAISNGHQIVIDEVTLSEMPQIAAGGVGLTVVAGSTNWAVDDQLRILVTNAYTGLLARAFDRLYQTYEKGIVLPNATSPTIADSLMT